MAKRKKRMKLPNRFGSIKYLGEGRRNPYAAYPPVTEYSFNSPVTPKALGYRETWEDAYELLTAYNMEKKGQIKVSNNVFIDRSPTFATMYEDFFKEKYRKEISSGKKTSSMYSTQAAFKNSSAIHDMQMAQIRYKDLQDTVNNCGLRHASLELIVSLMHQMFKYALKYDIVEKDYSTSLYIPIEDDDESGEPFNTDELKLLWENKNDDIVQMLLIMCYSGYRIAAYTNMKVNLEEKYFFGGVKNKYSRERTVPIYSGIYGFVCNRPKGKNLLGCSTADFRKRMYEKLEELGILNTKNGKKHTPHDCRHTFSMLCEKYGVKDNDRKRMMGHSFGNDVTNAVYGHRTLDDLREEIEKIKIEE